MMNERWTQIVELSEAPYPVVVRRDGVEALGMELRQVFSPRPCVVVTNPVVGALYGDTARESLEQQGFSPTRIDVPDGESAKTMEVWHRLCLRLLDARVDRNTPVLALGGGVTGDLVGFAAATVLRGVPLVQVPTTLLAMVDSSVGGKTGVNTQHGKNLMGAFYQPRAVIAPLGVLGTLPNREVRAGLGEVVKHALVGASALLPLLEDHAEGLASGTDLSALATCVLQSCALKARIVAEDPKEHGCRVLLNFGHTVGHGLETVLSGRWPHGWCVAVGLLAEMRWAVHRGWTAPAQLVRLHALLTRLGLPTEVPLGTDISAVIDAVGHDKKRDRATLTAVWVDPAGQPSYTRVSLDEGAEMVRFLGRPIEVDLRND